jgi:hypothetical protein
MSFSRPLPSHIRSASLAQGPTPSPALQARVNEKRAELASLRELQALSASVADQMQQLEDKLSTLADGTEGTCFTNVQKERDRLTRGSGSDGVGKLAQCIESYQYGFLYVKKFRFLRS